VTDMGFDSNDHNIQDLTRGFNLPAWMAFISVSLSCRIVRLSSLTTSSISPVEKRSSIPIAAAVTPERQSAW